MLMMWSKASELARQTPPERNRYVDFLRAMSIIAVVVGHWLVAAPYIDSAGSVQGGHLLGILPWSQWLTWGFQVMPIFFLVGGYSNVASWEAEQRKGGRYSDWFAGRIQRLINPVFPPLLAWALFAFAATQLGMERDNVRMATLLALIPVWFLAVYLLVTALAPITYAAWNRWGFRSFFLLVVAAILVDRLGVFEGVPHVRFLNFLFVWVAIHQLGYAWRAGAFRGIGHKLFWIAASFVCLLFLTILGTYPVAMIGVPGAEITNSMPPTIALLALGMTQTGIVVALEPAGRRMLQSLGIWTATVLMNGMIMTVYLWHLTAFVLVVVAAWLLGGIGLETYPGTADWWLARPVWFALYVAALLPFIAIFGRYERTFGPVRDGREVPHLRLVSGLLLICLGLAMTAALSIASPEGVSGVRLWVVALPFVGAALVGFGPLYRWIKRPRTG
jgi:hypothetical protein